MESLGPEWREGCDWPSLTSPPQPDPWSVRPLPWPDPVYEPPPLSPMARRVAEVFEATKMRFASSAWYSNAPDPDQLPRPPTGWVVAERAVG